MEEMEIFRRLVTVCFARRTSLSERALGDPGGPRPGLTSDSSSVVRLLDSRRDFRPAPVPNLGRARFRSTWRDADFTGCIGYNTYKNWRISRMSETSSAWQHPSVIAGVTLPAPLRRPRRRDYRNSPHAPRRRCRYCGAHRSRRLPGHRHHGLSEKRAVPWTALRGSPDTLAPQPPRSATAPTTAFPSKRWSGSQFKFNSGNFVFL
jgi:hypothetical protein